MSRHIDLLPRPPVMKEKKIIVLSFARNGTMGLHHALEILGYKPYHMKTVFETGASHLNLLNDAIEAKYHGRGEIYGKKEFDKWFADYDVILDVSCFFVPEIVAAYPDAKFILTHRDPDKWVKSVNNTMLKMVYLIRHPAMAYLPYVSEFMAAWSRFGSLAPRHIWKDNELGDDAAALQTYHDHNELVRKLVPAEKLLEVKLEDGLGWEEICPFLEHKVPDTRYPRGNDPREFKNMINGYLGKALVPVGIVAAIAATAVSASMMLPVTMNV